MEQILLKRNLSLAPSSWHWYSPDLLAEVRTSHVLSVDQLIIGRRTVLNWRTSRVVVSRRDKLVHLVAMVRLVTMDRTGISLPLAHMIPRWKKLMARKFTGVEHIRNCTLSSRYLVGVQWHYTCRRQVMDLLMKKYWSKSSVCLKVSTLNTVVELVCIHLILLNFAAIYS
jgi:hypothetical protein